MQACINNCIGVFFNVVYLFHHSLLKKYLSSWYLFSFSYQAYEIFCLLVSSMLTFNCSWNEDFCNFSHIYIKCVINSFVSIYSSYLGKRFVGSNFNVSLPIYQFLIVRNDPWVWYQELLFSFRSFHYLLSFFFYELSLFVFAFWKLT